MKTGKIAATAGISFAAVTTGTTAFYFMCKKSPSFKKKADRFAETSVKNLFESVSQLKTILNRKS